MSAVTEARNDLRRMAQQARGILALDAALEKFSSFEEAQRDAEKRAREALKKCDDLDAAIAMKEQSIADADQRIRKQLQEHAVREEHAMASAMDATRKAADILKKADEDAEGIKQAADKYMNAKTVEANDLVAKIQKLQEEHSRTIASLGDLRDRHAALKSEYERLSAGLAALKPTL